MSLTCLSSLELLALHNTRWSKQNCLQPRNFPVKEIRELASHEPLSYFPSTRSSWPYRTMKWCSENRSSSVQETTPVRLRHFLVESDMSSQTVTEIRCQFSLSQQHPETKGGEWWRVAVLTVNFFSKNICFSSSKSLTLCGLNCPKVRCFHRELNEIQLTIWDSSSH